MAMYEGQFTAVLLGKTGSGKSATGNNILGGNYFKEGFSSESVTRHCEKHEGTVERIKISVIDTPGLFNTSLSEEELKAQIEQSISLSSPGPHVFLLVIRVGRVTEEERNSVKWIQENFGEEALKFTIILLTGKDLLDTEMDFPHHYPEYQKIRYYHVLNNKEKKEDRTQIKSLLEMINVLVKSNGEQHYTSEMYQEAQRLLKEKEERETNERKAKEKEEAIKELKKQLKQIMLLCIGTMTVCAVWKIWQHFY